MGRRSPRGFHLLQLIWLAMSQGMVLPRGPGSTTGPRPVAYAPPRRFRGQMATDRDRVRVQEVFRQQGDLGFLYGIVRGWTLQGDGGRWTAAECPTMNAMQRVLRGGSIR